MLHQYEYQEDVYLALDGSASVYVSASLPSLVALDGMDLPTDPRATIDRGKIRAAFTAPGVTVSAIRTWRRWGRRFVTVGVDVEDIRRLSAATPFAKQVFEFGRVPSGYRFAEYLGPAVNRPVGDVGWDGRELVGFRWHIASKIERHNTRDENFLRGNILVWEQPLAKRLGGAPLIAPAADDPAGMKRLPDMEVVMEPTSILSGALWLFGVSAITALAVVALLLWWVASRGKRRLSGRPQGAAPTR